MSKCFVCKKDMTVFPPHPEELLYRKDDSAHLDCVWELAKKTIYGDE
jgi:hypothetical protein